MKLQKNEERITQILNDPEKVRMIIQKAIDEALLKHKQTGNPVCELRDGKVVWIKPQDIVIRN